MTVPADLQAQANAAEGGWRWDKAACRFCGTGCGIMLATKEENCCSKKVTQQHQLIEDLIVSKVTSMQKLCMEQID